MRTLLPALGVLAFLSAWGVAQAGQTNSTAVGLLVGEPEWLPQASSIAKALDNEDRLRVLPIIGAGGLQALQDLSQLQSVDAALVAADSLVYAKTQNLLSGKIAYITSVSPLPVVLIARRGIENVTGLAGKRIATGPAQSSEFATGELLFGALEIPFLRVPAQGAAAINALLNGKADAALVLGSDVANAALQDERFHMISLPLAPQLAEIYSTTTLTVNGKKTDTVATTLMLAVFDWPRGSNHYATLQKFQKQLSQSSNSDFSSQFENEVAGWTRFSAAKKLLSNASTQPTITPTGGEP
jgi:uncharacterized protein